MRVKHGTKVRYKISDHQKYVAKWSADKLPTQMWQKASKSLLLQRRVFSNSHIDLDVLKDKNCGEQFRKFSSATMQRQLGSKLLYVNYEIPIRLFFLTYIYI